MDRFTTKGESFLHKYRRLKKWQKVVSVMACIVVFCTTYALILPAITLTNKTYCGQKEHVEHTADCYTEQTVKVCHMTEGEGHKHTDSCYTIPEITREEVNEDGETVIIKEKGEPKLTCGKQESEGHKHSDSCYKTEKKLTCNQQIHKHTEACLANPHADVEKKAEWEKSINRLELTGDWALDIVTIADSQIGYKESRSNYVIEDDDKKGYTRYGAWYGDQHGDWCAMFASFCLYYAGVDQELMPIDASCQNWIDVLSDKVQGDKDKAGKDKSKKEKKYDLYRKAGKYEPKCGDLIFFDWDKTGKESDHVGIVSEVKRDKEDQIVEIVTIEGNSSDMVKSNTYKSDDPTIMGYAELPENPDFDPEAEVEEADQDKAEEATEVEPSDDKDAVVDEKADSEEVKESEEATEEETTEVKEDTTETNIEEVIEESESSINETDEAEEVDETEKSEESVDEEETKLDTELRYTKEYEGTDYIVKVLYSEAAQIPEDAELVAEEYSKNSNNYKQRYKEFLELYNLDEDTDLTEEFRLFGISFIQRSGLLGLAKTEIEPKTEVKVTITYKDVETIGDCHVTHFGDKTEMVGANAVEDDGDAVISFNASGFSDYGIALLAEDDGIALLAANDPSTWPKAPATGNLKGVVVQQPVVGEWYIIYGYSGSGTAYALTEWWPNRGTGGGDGNRLATLHTASTQEGGTVEFWLNEQTYSHNDEITWQYVGDGGFRNRYGYYLYMTTSRSGYSWNYSYSADFSVSTNPGSSTRRLNHYDWNTKTFYADSQFSGRIAALQITSNGYSSTPTSRTSVGHSGLNQYLAQVTNVDTTNVANGNHPPTTVTGTAQLNKPVLYSLDASSTTMQAVAGVEYTIKNSSGAVVQTIHTNGSSIDNIINGLDPGTYTVEQTAVPSGYVVTPQKRTITIASGGNGYVGTYYVYKDQDFKSDKTGQVIDYANRIYQIDISGQSGKYHYEVDPIHLDLVVDVSNSMLFPAELVDTGKTVTFNRTGGTANATALNNLNLDKKQTYYFVADTNTTVNPAATSTVYALYWCGNAWVYQDASFYSKAYRHWEKGDENNVKNNRADTKQPDYVQYVQAGDSYDQRDSRGGDVTKTFVGCTAIENSFKYNNGTDRTTQTFKLYTATEYNRLHELQQAVATLGSLVQSFNPASTIRMETFAKEVYECNQYTMNNQGLLDLIDFANRITTEGGTRQDLAFKHLIGNQSNTKGTTHNTAHLTKNNGQDDYVILITDGAPNTTNAATTISEIVQTATNIKNNYMEGNDRLITVGLSSENIAGNMLPDSASSPSSKYYKKVEESGQLTQYFLDLFYSELMGKRKTITSQADIIDEVSDSFYITDKDGNALAAGTRIDLNGNPSTNGPGLICHEMVTKTIPNPNYDENNEASEEFISVTDDLWYVKWDNQTLGTGATTGQYKTFTYYPQRNQGGTPTILDVTKSYSIGYNNNGGNCPITGTYDAGTLTSGNRLVYENGTWVIRWSGGGTRNITDSGQLVTTTTTGSPAWHGKVYLKAKEDFIGGNVIDSNKEAGVYIREGDYVSEKPLKPLETPTLNVRLLPLEGFESEETVFLGDDVKDIKDKLQTLLEKTVVEKIKKRSEDPLKEDAPLDKVGKGEDDGVYDDHFTIPYAIRELTDEEWSTLINGGTVKVDYTYDDASSHGAVGYFEFKLTKEGDTSDYNNHTTTETGEDVEKYKLEVTYTAYKKNEVSQDGTRRPTENVHNGPNGPGTEVGGTSAGNTLETGKGTESVDEIHHVHVIDGEIFLTKVIDETMVSDQDQTFSFELYKRDSTTGQAVGDSLRTVTVTVPAGQTEGTIHIDNLPRNNYIVKERDSTDYRVEDVEIVTKDTTCIAAADSPTLEFDIGTNTSSTGKNPNHNVIIFNENSPKKEASMWVNGERYVYSKPFAELENVGSSSSGTTSPGYHTETREEEMYAWESGTVISTNTSGNQYTKLTGTTSSLDSSHTSYGVLTQNPDNEDNWTITWTNWTSKTETDTTYDWPEETLISTNISGNQYERLTNTQSYYDSNHTSYGILNKNSSGNWIIEWHIWTSRQETVSGGNSSYDAVTISYLHTSPANLSSYANNGYYFKNSSGSYELITAIRATDYNIIITTSSRTNYYVQDADGLTKVWDNSGNATRVSLDIYKKNTGTTTETKWTESVTTENAVVGKLPTTTTTNITWSKDTSTATADNTKIPKTTKTIEVEVPDDPSDDSGNPVATVEITKLSAGHGKISNAPAEYTAKIPVKKIWEGEEPGERAVVYVVLYQNDVPVLDADGNARMLKLYASTEESENWCGEFEVAIPSKGTDPKTLGYYIREVSEVTAFETDGYLKAKVENDPHQANIVYVKIANDKELVSVNGNTYGVYYSEEDPLIISNKKAYALPMTGGIGTDGFTLGGLLLISMSLLYGFALRRKRERRIT